MGSLSIWHWIIVLLVVMVLFGGRGKISNLMGDFAQGIKAFKKGMAEDDTKPAEKEPVKSSIIRPARGRRRRKRNATPRAYAPEYCRGGAVGLASRRDLGRGVDRQAAAPWS